VPDHFFLRRVYYLLYHQFSWIYDFIASIISLGHWQDWVQSVLPFLHGRILEIGFGPGYLQRSLYEKNLPAFGLDESSQMARRASSLLNRKLGTSRLIRGYAQHIPFASGVFDSIVATFPGEYIFDPSSLHEFKRVLNPSGKLIILLMAWITGPSLPELFAAWLLRVSGEAPGNPGSFSSLRSDRIALAGFVVQQEILILQGSQVLVIVAEKREGS
jgi:ubiquinone/menaquinone biosynthesis C-methylase UbiE